MRARRGQEERAPRLVMRFAVLLALGLAVAAALILVVVRHGDTAQAERSAIGRARFATEAIVKDVLRPADLGAAVTATRRRELDAVFSRRLLLDGTVRVTVYGAGGTATYSTDHRLIGHKAGDAVHLQETLRGQVVSSVESLEGADRPASRVLVTSVPIVLGTERETGAVAFEQDYEPIAAAANEAFLPIAGVLEVILVLLFVLLLPVLARVSSSIRRHVAELEHVAMHDELTGLPNRVGFQRALASALARSKNDEALAVLVIDLDGFKEVNDALGHDAGDGLLVQMGERLRSSASGAGALARLGADEFGVLLHGAGEGAAGDAAAALRRALAVPLTIHDVRISLGATAGVATAVGGRGDAESLLRCAGVALHLAKDRRSGVEIYDPRDDASDASQLALIAELREAIPAGQLVVHYQAQSDIRTGVLRGAEALVRWQHPVRGLLPPAAFVPLAERAGLVTQIGRFVLGEAVRQWRSWRERGIELDVSVNLTTVDLLDLALPDDVLGLLRLHGMPPHRLVLEITESTLMGDERRTLDVLERLRAIGVRLAIDDFGTGYSSLSYLRRLPVDEVKIDRDFVAGVPGDSGSASIVRLTIELAHTFGLRVVAEGVETAEQLEHLAGLGCDVAQGYLIGRPVPPDELAAGLGPPQVVRDDRPPMPRVATLPLRPGR